MTQTGRRVEQTAAGFGVIRTGAKKTTTLSVVSPAPAGRAPAPAPAE